MSKQAGCHHCRKTSLFLSGGALGPIGRAFAADRPDRAETRLAFLREAFGDRLYVELQRQAGYDRALEAKTVALAYEMDLPLVATNEAFFTRQKTSRPTMRFLPSRKARFSNDDRRRLTPDHHMKSRAEMAALFADLPEALDNTVEIAERCSWYTQTRAPILPRFTGRSDDAEAAVQEEADELARQAREGLKDAPGDRRSRRAYGGQYAERLEYEIGITARMKFPGYFLIVADFIKWAKPMAFRSGRAVARVPVRSSPMR